MAHICVTRSRYVIIPHQALSNINAISETHFSHAWRSQSGVNLLFELICNSFNFNQKCLSCHPLNMAASSTPWVCGCKTHYNIEVNISWHTSQKLHDREAIHKKNHHHYVTAIGEFSRPDDPSSLWRHEMEMRYWHFVRGIHQSLTKASALWCFLWSAPEQTVE